MELIPKETRFLELVHFVETNFGTLQNIGTKELNENFFEKCEQNLQFYTF